MGAIATSGFEVRRYRAPGNPGPAWDGLSIRWDDERVEGAARQACAHSAWISLRHTHHGWYFASESDWRATWRRCNRLAYIPRYRRVRESIATLLWGGYDG